MNWESLLLLVKKPPNKINQQTCTESEMLTEILITEHFVRGYEPEAVGKPSQAEVSS